MKKLILTLASVMLWIPIAFSQPKLHLLPYAQGFNNPVDIISAGDDRLFVVQQRGLIRILDAEGNISDTPFLDLTTLVSQDGNERGLLGLAFHPDYLQNGYFFVNYTRTSDGATTVARYNIDANNPEVADAESGVILLTIEQPFSNHNAGNLLFGPDGYLYIATGDGGSGGDPQNFAQNRQSLLGKMLRIDVDNGEPYGIPADNPFVNDESTRDEIWALGLRNHWRNSFDRLTGDLWIADVGQSALEEINFQAASSPGGENYGWRCYEGNNPFNQAGCDDESVYTFPVFEYAHQGSACTGSVTGGYVYRGALYNALYGTYITADFCRGEFFYVRQNEAGDFEGGSLGVFTPQQYTAFGQDQYGELFIALRGSGLIHSITDTTDCRPVAQIWEEGPFTLTPGEEVTLTALHHPQLQYQWSVNGEPIEGAVTHILQATTEGDYSVLVTNSENECSNQSPVYEVRGSAPSSISDHFLKTRIYPNPVSDRITLEGLPYGETLVQLTDLSGRVLKIQRFNNDPLSQMETSDIPEGIYFVVIRNSGERMVAKVMVVR